MTLISLSGVAAYTPSDRQSVYTVRKQRAGVFVMITNTGWEPIRADNYLLLRVC